VKCVIKFRHGKNRKFIFPFSSFSTARAVCMRIAIMLLVLSAREVKGENGGEREREMRNAEEK
jgi:hypothetical protein